MMWIFVAFWWGDFAATTTTMEFKTEAACKTFQAEYVKARPGVGRHQSSCIPKGE